MTLPALASDVASESLLDVFEHYARRTPSAPFLIEDRGVTLSYADAYHLVSDLLPRRLQQLCPILTSAELEPERTLRVVIVSPNNALLVLIVLALWHLSCTAVPLPPRADGEIWTGMLAATKPALVLVSPALVGAFKPCLDEHDNDVRLVSLPDVVPGGANEIDFRRASDYIPACKAWLQRSPSLPLSAPISGAPRRASSSAGALTLFTSSAVDRASVKSVTYTHTFLLSSAQRTAVLFADALATPVRHLGWMPLSHCFEIGISLFGVVLPSGGAYVFFDPTRHAPTVSQSLPHQLLAALAYFGDTDSLSGVPYIAQGIVDVITSAPLSPSPSPSPSALSPLNSALLTRLRLFAVAGAPTPQLLFEWMVNHGIKYADASGCTEILWLAARRAVCKEEVDAGLSMCSGLMGVIEVQKGEDGLTQGVGVFGELIVLGKDLPTHYDTDNSTSNAFAFDPATGVTTYRTGDLYDCLPDSGEIPPGAQIIEGDPLPAYDAARAPLIGLTYIGRRDDILVLSTGEKVSALELECDLETDARIARAAVIANEDRSEVIVLVQPAPSASKSEGAVQATSSPKPEDGGKGKGENDDDDKEQDWRTALTDAVLRVNASLPFEKRVRRRSVYFVESLPVTAKNTLHRKRLWKMVAEGGVRGLDGQVAHVGRQRDRADTSSTSHNAKLSHNGIPQHGGVPQQNGVPRQNGISQHNGAPPHNGALPHDNALLISPDLRRKIIDILARVFDLPKDHIERYAAMLDRLALSSLALVQLTTALNETFGIQATLADIHAARTVDELCRVVSSYLRKTAKTKVVEPHSLRSEPIQDRNVSVDEICITGVACRFVGGIDSLSSYWSALLSPDAFLETLSHGDKLAGRHNLSTQNPTVHALDATAAGLTAGAASSFASFFGVAPRDAEAMSPNARLVPQLGYEAIEDAGIAPRALSGKVWAVFTVMNESGWRVQHANRATAEAFSDDLLNLADDAAAGRLAYFLNLLGPAVDIKTACSSAAVAIHQASLAIRNGDCDAALVIGATTHVHPSAAAFRLHAGIASPSGRCLPFSQWADGFVPSEGTAAIVLQRRAEAAVEPYAILRASAVVQDGSSRSFLVPNPDAQKRLLRVTLERARCGVDHISFYETHGTGTQIGDSIELHALEEVFGEREAPLHIGSSKAVVGHTEECAGLAGVIKALLCLKHNMIPPQPFAGPLSEQLQSPGSHLSLPFEPTFLPHTGPGPKLVGVSSFGLTGTLANIILQELPRTQPPSSRHQLADTSGHVFTLSAATQDDLRALARRYLHAFGKVHMRQDKLASICATTRYARDHHSVRRAFHARSWRQLLDQLQVAANSVRPGTMSMKRHGIGIWFGAALDYRLDSPIDASGDSIYESELARIDWLAHYKFFARQLALARTLTRLGATVTAVGGVGLGELVAGIVAGVIDDSAVFRSCYPGGDDEAFAIAHASQDVLEEHLVTFMESDARIVGKYSSKLFALQGTTSALSELASTAGINLTILEDDAIRSRCHIDPTAVLSTPSIPLVSGHLAEVLDDATVTSAAYWSRVQRASMDNERAFSVLSSQCSVVVDLSTLREPGPGNDGERSVKRIEDVLCSAFEAGCDIDWKKCDTGVWPMKHIPGYVWADATES